MKKILLTILALLIASAAVSSALTLDELFNRLQANKGKIKSMQADISTTITSTVKEMNTMVQKGHIWTKGTDKSKTEMYSPTKQITITNGDMMAMISPDTGQKQIQDLSKIKGHQGQPASSAGRQGGTMDLEAAKEKFDFSLRTLAPSTLDPCPYIITGIPKDDNKFMGKMEVYVDSAKMVPTKISIFTPTGKLMNETKIEYKKIAGVYVAYKNSSSVNLPNGSMKVEMVYSGIKINEGINDKEFEI
ncbi:outer membrane lipoprotein carrier protein LolA [Candidatus Margulisiibacteriota bacterium]